MELLRTGEYTIGSSEVERTAPRLEAAVSEADW